MSHDSSKEHVLFATKREHFEEAFRLVYREYLSKGYSTPNVAEMRILFYHAIPDTVTFCLWRDKALLATASLIFDSPMGLPMEDTYPDEVQKLRASGRRLCEVSLLALNSDLIPKGIQPLYFAERLRRLYHIFKPVLWYARGTTQATDLCIAVNPVHRLLYTSLHFEQFGEERVYNSVNGNPSIALRLNFDDLDDTAGKKTPGVFKLFLKTPLELQSIHSTFRWSLEDFTYFFCEKSDVLKNAKPNQLDFLTQAYPEFPIAQLRNSSASVKS